MFSIKAGSAMKLASASTALLVAGCSIFLFHGKSTAVESLQWTPHPAYGRNFQGCEQLSSSGIDNSLLNGLVRINNPMARGGTVVNGLMDALAPGHDAESAATLERIRYIPVAEMVCNAASHGRQVTFVPGWFSGKPASMVVRGPRGSVKAGFDDVGQGLDGERVIAMTSYGSGGDLDVLHGDSLPVCLGNSVASAEAGSALIDSVGGLLGAFAGSGSKENQSLRETCRMVATQTG